jgi:hypothetical protein
MRVSFSEENGGYDAAPSHRQEIVISAFRKSYSGSVPALSGKLLPSEAGAAV